VKKVLLILVAIIVIVGVVVVIQIYTKEPDKEISIRFPKGWEVKQGAYGTKVMGLSPLSHDADNFAENVNVCEERVGRRMTLEKYRDLSYENMQEKLTQFEMLDEGVTELGGRKARWIVYSHVYSGLAMKVKAFLLIVGRWAFVITCTATPDTFDAYAGTFDAVAETFTMK
jgi:serine/threonine-protein kinase